MPCSCCETGRCCNGATCTATSNSECAYNSGSFTAGGDCSVRACTDPGGQFSCSTVNPCACANVGYTSHPTATSCDCRIVPGACPWYSCQACNASTGQCFVDCPSPRVCCAGTCCPITQRCQGGTSPTCVDKCTTGSFCAGSGSAYACCTAGQKCCGPSGCIAANTNTNFSVNVAVNDWVDTGVTVTSGASVTITATGSCDRCASGTVEWANQGSTATPNGVTSGACNCCDGASVNSLFCHMALIGKIGLTGTHFLVGSSYSGTPGAGTLYLRQNDTVVGDNRGAFTGTITTDPCPGFTPAAVGEPIVYAPGEKPVEPAPGTGAALKALLKLAGIVASPTCSCNARAAQMDAWGEWGCLTRLPEICGWLKEEAAQRGLWFFWPAGLALVLCAVSLSALKRPFRGNNR